MFDYRSDDEALASAANHGDKRAAAEYFNRHLEYLAAMARYLASSTIDPEDLLSEAVVGLLAVWSQGKGPTTGVNSYLLRSMRNRLIDEYRSPRSRLQQSADEEEGLPPFVQSTRVIDMYREASIIREAVKKLPQDQQIVLWATIVEGRKPSELETELNRPASAIYALGRRARVGLKRVILQTVLEEDAPAECLRWSSKLPETVTSEIESAPDSRGMKHIRECKRCRTAWARFTAMGSALSMGTVVVLSGFLLPAPAAQASGIGGDGPADAENGRSREQSPSAGRFPSWFLGRWGILISVLAVLGGVVLVSLSVVNIVGNSNGQGSGQAGSVKSSDSPIELIVTTQKINTTSATLTVVLDGIRSPSTITLKLPEGLSIRYEPQGWDCLSSGDIATCAVTGSVEGTFDLLDEREDESGRYSLTVEAKVGNQLLSGFATGLITSDKRSVDARVE